MPDTSQLYDRDFYLWTRETAEALRARRFADLDIDHIAEQIEDMGKSNKRELESRITQVLEHQLKLRVAKGTMLEYNQNAWQASIVRQRNEIELLLKESPSLRDQITPELIQHCYRRAASAMAAEYKVEPPADCPFTPEDIL